MLLETRSDGISQNFIDSAYLYHNSAGAMVLEVIQFNQGNWGPLFKVVKLKPGPVALAQHKEILHAKFHMNRLVIFRSSALVRTYTEMGMSSMP